MADAVTVTRYRVEGMDCAACAGKIDRAVRRLPGVEDVSVSATAGTMIVRQNGDTGLDRLDRAVTELGYRLLDASLNAPGADRLDGIEGGGAGARHDHAGSDRSAPWWRARNVRPTAAAGLALLAAFALGNLVPSIAAWAFVAAMLVGLVPVARRAFQAARAGTPFSIEMLMTVAALGAVAIGAAEEAAAVVFLFLIGELLEGVAAGRARASIQGLAALVPKTARLERNGSTKDVPADSLQVDAVILVRSGDRIAADGVILAGESSINEAPVTGESTPKRKGPGDIVFAGTINGDAALRVRVTAAAADNTIARVVKLVEEAQECKAPTERFIDRFSRYYTPLVVLVAALVAILPPLFAHAPWDTWIYRGLAMLLIGCPCALVISTPAAIAASLSAGARRGLLLKGGALLETVGRIRVAAFDKTGTLTEGKPKVTDIVAFDRDEKEVLRLAAALEKSSSHPLALAIVARAEQDGLRLPPANESEALGGKGVRGRVEGRALFLGAPSAAAEQAAMSPQQSAGIEAWNAEGKSVAVLLVDGTLAGALALRDEVRADAREGLAALTQAGIRIIMLTGDNRRTADAVGRELAIEVRAQLLPADKQRIVMELRAEGLTVAKIGDGINDAPALAAADIGIAMGSGTDVALETADAAILHGRVRDVAAMVALSKRTMRNIHQNIAMALGLKAAFLVTTVLGITGLWPAILADTGATVLVTLNALRLLKTPQGFA